MNEITVSAKTVDDAITEASIQLGITSDQLGYEVVEKGSAGFLGFGTKKAVIKAFKKEPVKTPQAVKEAKDVKIEKKENPVKNTAKEFKKEPRKENNLSTITSEAVAETEKFLINVMKEMGMKVTISSEIDGDGALAIELKGDNMGILIGKRGQTLDSLQYLANRVANRVQDGYVRVKLDTENYRERRKATLENLAKNIAYKVKKTKKPVSLEPMNPYERRIIHSILQSDPSVTTHSEGDEPYRKVVITLSKKN